MSLSRLKELWELAKLGQTEQEPLTFKALLVTALFPSASQELRRYFSYKAVPGIVSPYQATRERRVPDLVLGFRNGDIPVGISLEALNRHIVVAGATGAGKTNWLNFFASQLLHANITVTWLDVKNEARHLVRSFPDLRVFCIEDFRWNPLEVPAGVAPKHWLNMFSSVYAHAFGILHASEGAILQYVDDLYQQFGVYEGSRKFPCLLDLADYLHQAKVRPWSEHARYLSRTQNRIETLNRVLGDTVAVSMGFDIKQLLSHSWALELGSLKPDVQSFVAEALMMSLFIHKLAIGARNSGVSNVIIFDDGKKVWDRNKERRPAEGVPTITNIISQVREFGIAVIVADQDPQMLSESLLDNAGTKVCMALGSRRAINEMATAMGLSREQAELIYRFQPGHACIKTFGREPFLVVIPEIPIDKSVTDHELRTRMALVIQGLAVEPRVVMEPKQPDAQSLPRPLFRFLEHVALNPLLSVTERFSAMGLSSWTGERTVKTLVTAGLLTVVDIQRGGRGGKAKYLQFTPKARELLKSEGVDFQWKGRGSIRHLYWQHRIAESFREKGYHAEVEAQVGDVSLDVLAIDPSGVRTGVQVVTGELDSYEFVGIEKTLRAGLDEVMIACENDAALRSLEPKVKETAVGKQMVRLVLARELATSGSATGE